MKFAVAVALLVTSLCGVVSAAETGPARLVKDIMPMQTPADSDASEFCEMNGIAYYRGYHPSTGYELWRTDGTEAGTWIVKDVLPGAGGSEPKNLTAHNDYLYFLARAESNSYRLWRTGGTAEGTEELLADTQYTGVTNFYISSTGKLYLEANTPENKHLLVATDGTAGGSIVLKELAPHLSVAANFLGDAGETSLFLTTENPGNRTLWRTDGTSAGTTRIPMPTSVTQYGSHGVELNGQLYFLASGGLWKSDGTAEGTALAAPAWLLITGNNDPLAKVGNTLYFTATNNLGHQLWKSDGTAEGTVMVNENHTGSFPHTFTVAGGLLYYVADKAATFPLSGSPEVWRSDGTAAGTFPLTHFNTPGQTMPMHLVAVGDKLYFRATADGDLYVSDGTVDGTYMVKAFDAQVSESYDFWPTGSLGTSAIFTAEGGTGRDLWISEGTSETTRLVYEPQAGTDSDIADMIAVGDKWFFHADDGVHGRERWVSDGTPEGTFMLKDIWPGSGNSVAGFSQFAALNGKVYFVADTITYGGELWESDGTEAGTRMVKDIEAGIGSSWIEGLVSSNGRIFFTAATAGTDREVWISDGTEAGTRMAVQLFNNTYQQPKMMAAMDGEAYFTCAEYGTPGSFTPTSYAFYKTDGTTQGTILLSQLEATEPDSSPGQQTAHVNGVLLFPWKSHQHGIELWRTDGTPSGTFKVKDFGVYSMPQYLTALGNYVYFRAVDNSNTLKLWRTDGSPQGTVVVSPMNIGHYGDDNELVAGNGKLYFSISGGANVGLWAYNPANGAMHRIHHLPMENPAVASDWLLYAANDGTHGLELWKSNGLASRTSMVQDIFPGGSSAPDQIVAGEGQVLFTAETAEHGRELWSFELKDLAPASASGWELYE